MAPYVEITRAEKPGKLIRSAYGNIEITTDLDTKKVEKVDSEDPHLTAMLPKALGESIVFRPDWRGKVVLNGEEVPKAKIEYRTDTVFPGSFVTDQRHTIQGWFRSFVATFKGKNK